MGVSDWCVLVVEDEFDSIQMVSKILEHHGATVIVARDGYECIAKLTTERPHLVIMDLALPKMDGWETLSRIRANPDTANIPVVAITAYHSVSVEEDAALAGFDAYFPKPLNTGSIVHRLEEIMDR